MRFRFSGLWRNPDFMRLWTGQTISEMGSRITRDGLPYAAVLLLGASPAQMGLLAAAGSAPVLLLGLVAGVWVDRLRRRPIMIAADLGRAALLATIPIMAVLGRLHIAQLYAVIALAGVLTVFFDVAYQSFLPSLVERENIVEGNSKLAVSGSVAELVGPALAGLLVQALTAPVAILFDALSFIVSAVSVGWIRKPEPHVDSRGERRRNGGASFWGEAVEGLRVVIRHPVLRAFAAATGTSSFFGNFLAALYALYAIRELGLGPAALGIIVAMGGAGDLIGALVSARVVRRLGLGPALVGAAVLSGLVRFLLPLAGGPPLVAAGFLVAGQLFGDGLAAIYSINALSLRQAVTPDRLLGRTNASMQLLQAGLGPLGALVGGILGSAIGVRGAVLVSAVGVLLSTVWLIRSPIPSLRQQPGPLTEEQEPPRDLRDIWEQPAKLE